MGIRFEFEVLLEVRRERRQSFLLAGHKTGIGILGPGEIRREKDTVQRQPSLECFDLSRAFNGTREMNRGRADLGSTGTVGGFERIGQRFINRTRSCFLRRKVQGTAARGVHGTQRIHGDRGDVRGRPIQGCRGLLNYIVPDAPIPCLRRRCLERCLDGIVHGNGEGRRSCPTGPGSSQVVRSVCAQLHSLFAGFGHLADTRDVYNRRIGGLPVKLRCFAGIDLLLACTELRRGLGDGNSGTRYTSLETRQRLELLSAGPGNGFPDTFRNIDDDTLVGGNLDRARPNFFISPENVSWCLPGGTMSSCFHTHSLLNSSPWPTKKAGVLPFRSTASRSAPSMVMQPHGPVTLTGTASRVTSSFAVFLASMVTLRVVGL